MKKQKSTERTGDGNTFFVRAGSWIVVHWQEIVLFVLSVAAVTAVNFFSVAMNQTVAAFRITDFEVGQIADRTIVAHKTLHADIEHPVTVIDGEKVIRKGFPITEEQFAKLRKMTESPAYFDSRSFADSELFLLVLAVLWLLLIVYVPYGRPIQIREIILQVVFFLLLYGAAAFGTKVEVFTSPFLVLVIIPTALCAFLITILYGQLPAILFSFISALGVFNAIFWEPVPFLFTLCSSLSAVWIVRKIERRIDLVVAALVMALLNGTFVILLDVIFNHGFSRIALSIGGVACNGFLSGILTLGLLTPLELLLNTASVFRLMDLSDLNVPIMRKMLVMAGGTYNHSLMVAQLAEGACREIGANPLIARVGGYYHDIGKIDQSEYFVENQSQMGGINKHQDINPSLSVSIIKSHVKKGVEMGHQLRLPQPIIDIIAEHHGNSVITYFYTEMKKKDPSVRPEDFSYPGIPPTTRESGIVMLADTVESACHTLDNPTAVRLEKFIQTLIDGKIEHNQMDNSALTYSDVAKAKAAFVQILTGYYHNRIKYQDQKDPDDIATAETTGADQRQETGAAQDTVDG
ncbi:MAG: HDIG domain-containing protein [Treponema sp.]|nr:HDIG domain-containing protein [Treponema sp.]